MSRESQEPTHYELIPTPHVGERAVKLWVKESVFHASVTPVLNTTLEAFVGSLSVPNDGACANGYGLYELTGPGGRSGDGYLGFLFAKPKTTAQRAAPFKTTRIWDDYSWPDVLKILIGVQGMIIDEVEQVEYDQAVYTGLSARTNRDRLKTEDRMLFYPGQRTATEFVVREYLSPTPFTGIKVERPIPTQIYYNHQGMVKSLNCLHPTVTVPELMRGARLIPDFGTPNAADYFAKGMVFPATDMLEWVPHLSRADMSDQDGVYYLKTYEALPPSLPRPQKI